MKKIIFLLFFSFFACATYAQQNKEDLLRKQQDLKREIEDLNKSLRNIQKNKKESIINYNLVKRKIAAREELIQNINKDVHILDNNIYLSQLEINRLKRQLDTLKSEYAKSLLFAYKNRSNYNYLNFIFSAATFNDAVKRITYLKSYRQYREQQVANIERTQQMVEQKVADLNSNKMQKSQALTDQNKQLTVLEEDRREQDQVVTKLKGQEKDLANQIHKREKERQQMQGAIAAIIRREQAEARKRAEAIAKQKAAEEDRKRKEAIAARQKAAAAAASNSPKDPAANHPVADEPIAVAKPKPKDNRSYSPFESTEEGKNESIKFENGRGRLPWPVDAGNVSIHFGSYTIPGTKLKGRSDGIYIQLPVGASVKAIADGEVSSVYDLGGEQAVTVRHGKYFTTYSHLSSTNVSSGQQVKSGTVLGRAAENDEGEGEVLFMVINDKSQFLNPEGWLKGR